jgi:hypothetical protein
VKCQIEVTKQLAGMQGKARRDRDRGRGVEAGVRTALEFGEDGVDPTTPPVFFFFAPILAQGRGGGQPPSGPMGRGTLHAACRPAHALPC